jgi:putative transposase
MALESHAPTSSHDSTAVNPACRRDLLGHVIILNRRHLKRLMNEYVVYYLEDRTHLALEKGTPAGREAKEDPGCGHKVTSIPRLGGLHHRYNRAA